MRWSGSEWIGRARRRSTRLSAGLTGLALLGLFAALWLMRPHRPAVMPGPQPLHGAQPYATLLCRFANPATLAVAAAQSSLPSVAYFDQLMTGGAGSLDDYWQQVSYGAISLAGSKAFGWFQLAKPGSAYLRPDLGRSDLDALARDCAAAAEAGGAPTLHLADYVGLNLVFSECIDRSRGGAMDLTANGRTRNFRVTWLCPGYASSHQIVAHEMGHSFGLTHSEDNQGAEYGNNWDVMSNAAYCAATTDFGTTAQQPIAYDKDVLGWIDPAAKYVVQAAGVATIQLDYLEQGGNPATGFLLAQIPLRGGRFYTVEARNRSGYDAALPTPGVLIHEIDPRRANRARLVAGGPTVGPSALLAARGGWPVGSAFIDADNNVAVSVDQQVGGGFVVTLFTGALPWPQDPALQDAPAQQVRAKKGTLLQWRGVPGVKLYEIQVSHLAPADDGATVKPGAEDWGATFVSREPSLVAGLLDGEYRWQVRALPDGAWSPAQAVTVGRANGWGTPEQVAHLAGALRVPPMINASDSGAVDVAWAQDDHAQSVSVTRAEWQGSGWAVADLLDVPSSSRRGLALSFTPAGDLKLAWPSAAVEGMSPATRAAMVVDAGGRAHTIWAGAGREAAGLFSAVLDSHAPSAGPVVTPAPRVQPVRVSNDALGSAKYSPALALDPDGNAQAVWIDARDRNSAVYTAEQHADGTWSVGTRLSDVSEIANGRPAIAVDPLGNAYAAWQGSVDCGGPLALTQISFAERRAGAAWQPAITLAAPGGDSRLFDPVVAANGGGELYVAWGEVDSSGYRLYSAYRGAGGQWESPRRVAEGPANAGALPLSLAVNPRGDAYLTWPEVRGDVTLIRFAATR